MTRTNAASTKSMHANHRETVAGEGLLAEFDALIHKAASGDARAIGAIAIAIGPQLREVARDACGEDQDADDVLQDFLHAMLEGRTAHFAPKPGRGRAWLEGVLRSMARKEAAERIERWGGEEP